MEVEEPRRVTFAARTDCHYLLRAPDRIDERTALVVTLHGFGSTPEAMLRLTAPLVGERHMIASLEGPHQFYASLKSLEVLCGWGTRRHPEEMIRLHHQMVETTLEQCGREFGIPPRRRVLAGFSQPVSLNYRYAATCPDAAGGVLAMCGGVPGDWEQGPYRPMGAAVLHISREDDEYYPVETVRRFPERLRLRAEDVEFHLMPGGHRVPSKAAPIVQRWLERILQT